MHLKATQSLYTMVGKIGKLLQNACGSDGEKAGVMPLFGLLFQKMDEEGADCVRMSDVSRHLMITKPAATQAVNKLVERGLVERFSDQNDRRVVYIRPTAEGRRIFEHELEIRFDFVDRMVNRIGQEDADQLVELLDKFLNAAFAELEEEK